MTALASALGGLTAPALAADPAPAAAPAAASAAAPAPAQAAAPARVRDGESAGTAVTLGEARIDPKVPGRVRVDVDYLCGIAEEARSLTVSVEQRDPEDPSIVAFGSSRTAEADILCDGTQRQRQLVVQSKTVNWIPDADAVLIATVSDLGATPPASSDARRVPLFGS
ncbi:hypothetical protein ACIPLC_16330 [Kitasatospora sp. NPDC086801]|uniref:hypothetical protein n=1 Tax=Kitasatospora sp. NPDC086801 TaxID=3364066 RepID=UPI0038049BF7